MAENLKPKRKLNYTERIFMNFQKEDLQNNCSIRVLEFGERTQGDYIRVKIKKIRNMNNYYLKKENKQKSK